jgi:hypothetical protein
LSKTAAGREFLTSKGWLSSESLPICVPKADVFPHLFSLRSTSENLSETGGEHYAASVLDRPLMWRGEDLIFQEQDKEREKELSKQIFTAVANLSNFISAESSSRTLKRYF